MVDPFFTTWNTSWNNWWNSATWNNNTTKGLDTLMAEQTEIQNKYKELKSLLLSEELTQNQIAEVKEQMQNLSDLYSHNKETIAALSTNVSGEKEIHVNKDVKPDESNSKSFSFRKILIGCWVLFLLLLWGLVAIFYSLMDNPNRLATFWIDGCTAVNLLQIFSIIFFWLLFFVWLALLLVNIYKTIVSKNKRKIWFILGIFFGGIIAAFTAISLVNMINKLNILSSECGDRWNKELADIEIRVKDTKFRDDILPKSEYNVLIAPINVFFTLNQVVYKNTIAPSLGSAKVTSITINCWNWQSISLEDGSNKFQNSCFYLDRWSYKPEVVIQYIDAAQATKTYEVPLQEINVGSALTISSEQWPIQTLNSTLIVWENPVNIKFNAANVFKDFNLPSYNIRRSAECDWNRNNSSAVDFSHQYTKEWVQDVCVSFPNLSEYIYTFPIRVEQWKIPDDFIIQYSITSSRWKTYDNNPTSIEISEIPTTLNLKISNITPSSSSTQKKLTVNWSQVAAQFSDPNLFKINIDEEKDYEIILDVSDQEKEIQTTKTIKVKISRAEVVWNLSVTPSTVWISPFTVKFDASTTTLNDTSDEIVFFSRDFWDWEQNKDLSESVITHTYQYDFDKWNWVYYPVVTMRTKKWLEFSVTWTIISVKKPDTSISISLDDHPAQIAKVWDIVSMSLSLDWMPKKVYRDFWDGGTLECDWRLCTETTHKYESAWSYSISVTVEFDGKPTLDWRINLLVQ